MSKFLKKYWLSILFIGIIFFLCFMNTSSLPKSPMKNFDKIVHILLYLGLTGVIFFDNTSYLRFPITRKRIFFGSVLFPIALGGIIEIMQADLTAYRSGDWFDFLSDAVGAFIGWGIALLINRYLGRKIQKFPKEDL